MRVLVAANPDLAGRLENTLKAVGMTVDIETRAAEVVARVEAGEGPVFLDHDMSGFGGVRAVQRVRAAIGTLRLVVVYALAAPGMAHRILSAGADAVVPGDLDRDEMRAMFDMLARGRRFAMFGTAAHFASFNAATALTDRELQVLHGVCDGLQNKEIAHQFGISEVTVKMHFRAVIRKLGARNRTHAAMLARDLAIA